MDRQCRPQSKLGLRKVQPKSNCRKREQGNGVQYEDGAQRDRHLVFGGPRNRTDSRDGAASANGRSGGDEECGPVLYSEPPAQQGSHSHREGNAQCGVEESAAPGVYHLLQVHPKAQADNGRLQQDLGKPVGFVLVGMSGDCSEEESGEQS